MDKDELINLMDDFISMHSLWGDFLEVAASKGFTEDEILEVLSDETE